MPLHGSAYSCFIIWILNVVKSRIPFAQSVGDLNSEVPLYLQKYSELQPKIWHAFIILTKVILGIFWAILEMDTWELLQKLVELTRNDPPVKRNADMELKSCK